MTTDNQQPSISVETVRFLARNAVFGDGCLWKHPECKNYKGVWTSISKELLEVKASMCPSLFPSGVKPATRGKGKGVFANASPLFRLASVVHPIFTEAKDRWKIGLISELTLEDFGLWYLDDGCCCRKDKNRWKVTLSIGDTCSNPEQYKLFTHKLCDIFGENYGCIRPNNSKASENNKVWILTIQAAKIIQDAARKYGIMSNKFPRDEGSTTILY